MSTTDLPSATTPCPAAPGAVNAAPRLPDEQARAWLGFLAVHADITRALDAGLGAEFGLSLSALEVLARLAWAPDGRLRMTDLALGALLSQSRVSRLVDQLAERGLIVRSTCPSDSRGVFAHITDPGRELIGRALEWHWAQVRTRFFATLSPDQVRELGDIWGGILGRPIGLEDATTCPNA